MIKDVVYDGKSIISDYDIDKEKILKPYKDLNYELNLALEHDFLAKKATNLHYENQELKELLNKRDEEIEFLGEKISSFKKDYEAKENIKSNILTVNVKATEIDEVKNIIASFIFMLEDSRIDRNIRLQYLESCKELKEQYFVRIDK